MPFFKYLFLIGSSVTLILTIYHSAMEL